MGIIKGVILIFALASIYTGCKKQSVSSDGYALVPYTVSETQIPPQIRKLFREASNNSPITRAELFISGDRLTFYVFQFRENSKLMQMIITPTGEITVHDAPDNGGNL